MINNPIITTLYFLTVISLIGVVISENRNPLKALAWVLVIGFVPIVGIVIYILFGQDQRRKHIISRRVYRRISISIRPKISSLIYGQTHNYDLQHWNRLKTLIQMNADNPVLASDSIEIYHEGVNFFDALKRDLQKASKYIHIESYIFEDDQLLKEIFEILVAKVAQGVKVRVLYDDVGSWSIKARTWKRLRQQGIQVYPFMPVVFPLLTSPVNYRNHRKIVIIDGEIGFMGGMNIADRYQRNHWCDTHFRLTGPAVAGIQSVFLVDWYVASRKVIYLDKAESLLNHNHDTISAQSIKIQFLPGGPMSQWRSIDQAFSKAIQNAKKYIYIQTPYFLPTETLSNALISAALSGVDVWLMVPAKGDSWITSFASESFFGTFLSAGIHIMQYQPGFLHSKLMMIDGEVSFVGSANMDFRSLEHNFEFSAVVYDHSVTKQLDTIFTTDLALCRELTYQQWLNRPYWHRKLSSLVRIFSPLL